MAKNLYKKKAEKLLSKADIKINGPHTWDIQVHDERLYRRIFSGGTLAAGEAYMDGWWDVKDLDVFFTRLFNAQVQRELVSFATIKLYLSATVLNMQSRSGSQKVAKEHYDLGNDFYHDMLDPDYMQYTCGYWKNAKNLNQAQKNKLDLVCKKLKLKKGEKVLELGCGWGGFAKYAAEKYGVEVTSYNISKEQVEYARKITKGLPVKIVHADYRDASGLYDKVVSIGMCEHIGYKNYRKFMKLAYSCLKPGGLFLCHTIATNKSVKNTDPWINKYIFPNSMLPSAVQLTNAFEGLFVLEDWHNFGPDYDKTLLAWDANFRKNWHKYKAQYGERFYRMWRFYLMTSAGQFRARKIQLWQIVLSKGGVPGGYESVR